MKFYTNRVFNEVRIFALNKENFPGLNDVIEYFTNELPNNKNFKFDLLKTRLNCPDNTLIYFQYEGRIIASAITDAPKENHLPIIRGSIRLFAHYGIPSKSLGLFGVKRANGALINKTITQGAVKIDPSSIGGLEGIMQAILSNRSALSEEQIAGEEEGKKVPSSGSRIERSKNNRMACLSNYTKIECQICGLNFAEYYGPQFTNKIHIHHIVPIASAGPVTINPYRDLIPVCPNCHYILHSKSSGGGYSVDEVKEFVHRRRKDNGYIKL